MDGALTKGAFILREEFALEKKIVLMFHAARLFSCCGGIYSSHGKKNELFFLDRENFDFHCVG